MQFFSQIFSNWVVESDDTEPVATRTEDLSFVTKVDTCFLTSKSQIYKSLPAS
jgi:hypothetical protein